ncbi:MAG: EF-P lysine aminoacylase GenX [Candidatus Marinimicrobia bacterium]|nr:EF-P lysine aminoacylase GenX [Candidatus Neomarinimicrobiota bacterium]MCF7904863.1 EF-P lysine aminoacylase GenX [Candidatus Neomarinimicrobiota bacterium]
MNKDRLEQKRALINLIRQFFVDREFFEIETPVLVPSPGMEPHLHGFKTSYVDETGISREYFLPTSPEFAIKKALGNGYEKVFEIARAFRNLGELGPQHHPEFNMLEWYRPGDYRDVMADVETLLQFISEQFHPLSHPNGFSWEAGVGRITIQDCFQEHASLDLRRGISEEAYWRREAQGVLNERVPGDDTFEDIFFRVWMKLIEPKLGMDRPVIVYDYPASMSALAQLKQADKVWAERFELYIQGVEIANAFSELRDQDEQRHRFERSSQLREELGYPPHPIDEDLIQAIAQMQPTGGIAIGLERLLMVLTGEKDISQFFLQPLTAARRR